MSVISFNSWSLWFSNNCNSNRIQEETVNLLRLFLVIELPTSVLWCVFLAARYYMWDWFQINCIVCVHWHVFSSFWTTMGLCGKEEQEISSFSYRHNTFLIHFKLGFVDNWRNIKEAKNIAEISNMSWTAPYLFQCSLVALQAGWAWRQRTEAPLQLLLAGS